MKESELLGKLMPGHPHILLIIENIREKYQLPEGEPAASADKYHRFLFSIGPMLDSAIPRE